MSVRILVSSPNFGTQSVVAGAVTTTGNTVLGDAVGDTFKTHGTASSGAQATFAAVPTLTAIDVATSFTSLTTWITQAQAALVNSGLMAPS